jgi:hypothetical protein
MLYKGMVNVPGAPGNLVAGGNFMGDAGSAINPEAFKKDARQQKIYNKGMGTDNPNENNNCSSKKVAHNSLWQDLEI